MNLILFDIDGRIINTEFDDISFIDVFKDTLNIKIRDTNWNNYKHATDLSITIDIFQEYLKRNPAEKEIKRIKESYINNLKQNYDLFPDKLYEIPGANNMIKVIKKSKDWFLGFATGCWNESAIFKLKSAKINMKNVEISDSNKFISKTDIINDAIHKITIKNNISEFNRIIYIGDRKYDYLISKELNIDFIGIDYYKTDILKELDIKSIYNDFNDISFRNIFK
jgi:phosphoglycolate phosphatase-like HAD superfamily hydrolase